MKKISILVLVAFAIVLAGCSISPDSGENSIADDQTSAEARTLATVAAGTLSLTVTEQVISNGVYAYIPFSGAGVYVDGQSPYGGAPTTNFLNASGKKSIKLSAGQHKVMVSKMTSSHSMFVSSNYTFSIVSGATKTLSYSVLPFEARVEAFVDAGYGNAVYITGYGKMGNWTTAYIMRYENGRWVWTGYAPKDISFKMIKYAYVSGASIATSTAGVVWEKSNNHLMAQVGLYTCNAYSPAF